MVKESSPSEIQDFLNRDEREPGEQVLGVTAYGPSSTLIVTNQRLIGKTQDQNPQVFRGSLPYTEILQVHYSPGLPVVGAPRLRLEYRSGADQTHWVTFHLPGQLFGNLLYRLAGYNPREIYRLIREQIDASRRDGIP